MRKVYHKIIKISGNVITVEAEGAAYNELAEVSSARGVSLAQVIRLDGNQVSLQVFAGARGISTGDQIRFLGREMTVSGSDALLGRVFNGRGLPRDNRPEVTDEATHRNPFSQPRQTYHSPEYDPYQYPHDRRFQHPRGVSETADLLRCR